MGLENFILTCEKDNESLRKDINYYKNYNKRLKKENQQLKEQLETSEKARKESMLILGEHRHYTLPTEEQNRENEDIIDKAYNNLILKQDIDKQIDKYAERINNDPRYDDLEPIEFREHINHVKEQMRKNINKGE